MLKENKIMCFLFVLALLVLFLGHSVNAADVNDSAVDASVDVKEFKDTSSELSKRTSVESVKESSLKDISLEMDDVKCDYGESVDMNVITTPTVNEGIMSWYVNDEIVGVRNLSNSPSSLALNSYYYRPGNYDVEVTYTGSSEFSTNLTHARLTVNKLASYIDNVVCEFDENNDITVGLNVYGGDYTIFYGTLNVYQANNLIRSLEIEDDDVTFTIDKTLNDMVLRFEYVGDEYYEPSFTDVLISVPKFKPGIHLSNVTGYQGDVISLPVTFYANRPVNDGFVDVYVDGVHVDEKEVSGSDVIILLDSSDYLSGNHSISVEYFGSDVFEDAHYTSNLNLRQIACSVYSYNVSGHKNDSVVLRAGVYNYVDSSCEGLVEFLLDGESIHTSWLNGNSIIYEYTVPDSLDYGLHELKVVYYGTSRYFSGESLASLNVTRYSNVVSVRNYSIDESGRVVVNIRSYSYNNTVDDGYLNVSVDGVNVGVIPVTGNVTSVVLPEEYAGDNDYEISVCYYGSEIYEDSNLTEIISPTRFTTSNRLYTYLSKNNIVNITSYVYSSDYSQINSGRLEFYCDDVIIGWCDVENNSGSILYNMTGEIDGTHEIKSVYNGTNVYRSSQNITWLNYTYNKNSIQILTSSYVNVRPSEKLTLNITITDTEENPVETQTYVTVNILNESFRIPTDDAVINWEYIIPDNTPEGTYNISITADETEHTKNATRNVRLNVYKDTPYITSPYTISSYKDESIALNATLNLNKQLLEENIVTVIKINNKTIYQGLFKNGLLEYSLKLNEKYTSNTYNLTIKTQETSKYHSTERTLTLNLKSRNTYITSENIESKNGEQIIINATVYDSITRKPVKDKGKVCIKINDVTLENIEITNGHILYAYTNDYSAKDYSIRIIYGENGIYNQSTWNGTLTIKSSKLKITTHNIQTTAYSTINIKANILSDNKPAQSEIKTAIKINNKTIHEENITNGIIDFNYTLSEEIGQGTYNITIIAGDTRKYKGDNITSELIVTKNYKEIKVNSITLDNKKLKVKALLVDSKDNAVSVNTRINIKLGGHTLTDFNITDGVIEYEEDLIETLTDGVYNLLIQAGETSGYFHATTTQKISVNS